MDLPRGWSCCPCLRWYRPFCTSLRHDLSLNNTFSVLPCPYNVTILRCTTNELIVLLLHEVGEQPPVGSHGMQYYPTEIWMCVRAQLSILGPEMYYLHFHLSSRLWPVLDNVLCNLIFIQICSYYQLVDGIFQSCTEPILHRPKHLWLLFICKVPLMNLSTCNQLLLRPPMRWLLTFPNLASFVAHSFV